MLIIFVLKGAYTRIFPVRARRLFIHYFLIRAGILFLSQSSFFFVRYVRCTTLSGSCSTAFKFISHLPPRTTAALISK